MDNKRALTEKELFEALINDSDDETYRVLPLEAVFSDVSDDEDVIEEQVENVSIADSENEEIPFTEDENSDNEVDDDNIGNTSERHWSYIASNTGRRRKADSFRVGRGLTDRSKHVSSILDCFKLFISDDIIDVIVKYTNQKAKQFMGNGNSDLKEQTRKWIDVDATEILGFLAILVLSGRFRESRESPVSLWSTFNDSFNRPIYKAIMSRNRFVEILRFIRFDDVNSRVERKENDKLAPIREVSDILSKNCRESYHPSPWGTIDEQLVSFRGRCPFRVYIPTKPGKYSIKIWTLCDVDTFYCCNFEVYLGKQEDSPEKNQGPRVVKSLATHWYGSGRNITMDNFFTDISLAEDLLKQKLTLIGTMRKNRKDIPKELLNIRTRGLYSSQFLFTKFLTLVSYVTKPKKNVVLLSSHHHQHEISGPENKFKPEIVLDYNKTKSGVDVLDKLVREYSCKRSTRRWPLRLFFNFVDVACYNAFVIWILKNPDWQSHASIKYRRKIFLEELGLSLANKNLLRRADHIQRDGRGIPKATCSSMESTGILLRKENKDDEVSVDNKGKRSRCYKCVGNDNKYSKKCHLCMKFVCPQHSINTTTVTTILCTLCMKNEDGDSD